MCPPAQPAPCEIALYWSDEQIILILAACTPGSPLPDNVLADLSPYQYPPSNFPEGIWFLAHPNEKKESAYGFWKAKGDACKVYTSSTIIGWRTTLEYFEGIAPRGQKTDWLMQEYKITPKELNDKDKPKDSKLLCRVFLCSGDGSKSEMNPQKCKTIVESENINPVVLSDPNTNITSEQDSESESKTKRENEVAPQDDTKPNSLQQDLWELDCVSRGDYLELDDLLDSESHSSSSQNSSCPSKLSDEYFDSSAFLRDLEEELNIDILEQPSNSSYNFSAPVMPNNVVLQPAVSESVTTGSVITDAIEALQTTTDSLRVESVQQTTPKRQNPESKTESSSSSDNVGGPSTSHNNPATSGEKKAGASRLKKLKIYFCFASF